MSDTLVARPAVSPLDRLAAGLNAAQRSAVAHQGGPMLVIAGAGTGKTMTLAARAARLVLDGTDPRRLLLLTFSRRAAAELGRRAGRLIHQALGLPAGLRAPELPWAGTFHAVAARLLREAAPRIGLAEDFTILDRADAEDLMNLQREALDLSRARRRFPLKGTCLAIYSRAVNACEPLATVLGERFPWCAEWEDELARLFAAYADAKHQQHALDYDDLLLCWAALLEDPGLAAEQGARFEQVLVDEYQDTNRLQATILARLRPDGRGLAVVGDDAQSIYAFRAAEVRNILDFPAAYSPPARVIALEQNYRSTQPLLDASNAVIAEAAERHPKRLWSERRTGARPEFVPVADDAAQAGWVADAVLARRENGLALKRQAVLFRTAHHSATLELELTRRGIPYVKFGGLKFLEASHVKDLLALLRWAQNPRGRLAGFRAALLVPGLGPASARRLLDAMDAADEPRGALAAFRPPPGATAAWAALQAACPSLCGGPAPAWPEEIKSADAWYRPQLRRLHADAEARGADLDQLLRIARSYPDRARFLAELTLDPPAAVSDEPGPPHLDEDYLILSTIHSAKGQEWPAVYVLNVVDGCIPSEMATGSRAEIEEERRLLYVAMTRAKDHLALVAPQRFYVTQQPAWGDRHLHAAASRFVEGPLAAGLFETVRPELHDEGTPLADGAAREACPPGSTDRLQAPAAGSIDVLGALRSRWSSGGAR